MSQKKKIVLLICKEITLVVPYKHALEQLGFAVIVFENFDDAGPHISSVTTNFTEKIKEILDNL